MHLYSCVRIFMPTPGGLVKDVAKKDRARRRAGQAPARRQGTAQGSGLAEGGELRTAIGDEERPIALVRVEPLGTGGSVEGVADPHPVPCDLVDRPQGAPAVGPLG